ncbi:MAG: bifunctional hydroxymethylpyrimidine kinase/phosphomethylpyrimidine kinase [Mariprofundaceae bacterium]|nr:bifunctional hydroxymethylpyrimidine kinase/phosphomethylpyrimidine kinase [Mariprofundaceae bacterium]
MSRSIEHRPVCLTIGGSDSCGGAGIQADLRVFEALGVQGCSAITALTAQNYQTIHRIEAVSLAQLDAELHAIFDVYDVAVVKTGMLLDAEHIAVISACLDLNHANKPLIVDPVLVSSSGKCLLDAGAIETLKHTLIKHATLLTPNLDEAAVFLGRGIDDVVEDAATLVMQFDCAVLLKGGHGEGNTCTDVLCEKGGEVALFSHPKQAWHGEQSHGSGCRLASAIAAHIAKGASLHDACEASISYLQS